MHSKNIDLNPLALTWVMKTSELETDACAAAQSFLT
jgi:hypothetical protein